MMRGIGLVVAVLMLAVWATAQMARAQDGAAPATRPAPDRAALEAQFEKTMSGAALISFIALYAAPTDRPPNRT